MPSAGAIFLIVVGRRLPWELRLLRGLRMFVVGVTVVMVMRMRMMTVRRNLPVPTAAATGPICAGKQHMRTTAAQSWSQDHCETEVRN